MSEKDDKNIKEHIRSGGYGKFPYGRDPREPCKHNPDAPNVKSVKKDKKINSQE